MAIKRNTTLRRSGNSDVVTIPPDVVRHIKEKTGEKSPEMEVYYDGIIIIRSKKIPLDEHTKISAIRILDDIIESESKEKKQE